MQQTIRLLRALPEPETPPMIAANVMRRIRAGETRPSLLERIQRVLGGVLEPSFVLPASAIAVAALVIVRDPGGRTPVGLVRLAGAAGGAVVCADALDDSPRESGRGLGGRARPELRRLRRAGARRCTGDRGPTVFGGARGQPGHGSACGAAGRGQSPELDACGARCHDGYAVAAGAVAAWAQRRAAQPRNPSSVTRCLRRDSRARSRVPGRRRRRIACRMNSGRRCRSRSLAGSRQAGRGSAPTALAARIRATFGSRGRSRSRRTSRATSRATIWPSRSSGWSACRNGHRPAACWASSSTRCAVQATKRRSWLADDFAAQAKTGESGDSEAASSGTESARDADLGR